MGKILIVGGAGYIGSHMVQLLIQQQREVVVVDNLSTGYQDALTAAGCPTFIHADISDKNTLRQVFSEHPIDSVIHFASFIQVGESVSQPHKYYQNNLTATLALLEVMLEHNVKKFIFSSTAAVYGDPEYVPIDEAHPKKPINPYGKSKWMVEQILEDYDNAYGLRYLSLRYFNAAGADPDGLLGERHDPETHLIPLTLQVASGRRPSITIFGSDYDTPDGTCIRDYIHVCDLVAAHSLALDHLTQGNKSIALNLGNGNGFSVRQVIETAKAVTGIDISVTAAERRPGDPPILIADPAQAQAILGWQPYFSSLHDIVRHAWEWEKKWPWHGQAQMEK